MVANQSQFYYSMQCSYIVAFIDNSLNFYELAKIIQWMEEERSTQKDKARIMSTQAKQHGGQTEKGTWPAKAQSAADKNEPPQQKWLELV